MSLQYPTRQDHIDPQIRRVVPCGANQMTQRGGDTLVIFTNNEWVCSSGHCSDYKDLPGLRRPELDPVAWIQANLHALSVHLPTELCTVHEDGDDDRWGMDGHLWKDGHEQKLTLCLPLTNPKIL